MKRPAHLTRALTLAAALGTLGFGAAQAVAAPSSPELRACSHGPCSRDCKARGADGGSCVGGSCICFIQAE
jgi:hypothetical protein